MAAQPPLQPTPEARAFSFLKEAIASDDMYKEFVPKLTDAGKARMEEAGLTSDGIAGVPEILTLIVREMENAPAAQAPPQPTPEARAFSLLRAAIADEALWTALLTDPGKERMTEAGLTPDGIAGVPEILRLMLLKEKVSTPELVEAQAEVVKAQAGAFRAQAEAIDAQGKALGETLRVFEDLKKALSSNVNKTTSAFDQTMWMYMVSFYTGVGLVVTAIVFAALGKQPELIPELFGGLGTASTIAFFFTKPPERLQSSRASLAQMQCAMLSWYTDFYNDQVILQQMGPKLGYKEWQASAKEYLHRTKDWMEMLRRSVDQAANISTDSSKSTGKSKSTDSSKGKDPATSSGPQ
jgi:hypothetical protein